jgi:hypothetical protein
MTLWTSFIGVEAMARRRFLSFLASVLLLAGAFALTVAFVRVFREHWRIAVSVLLGGTGAACRDPPRPTSRLDTRASDRDQARP